MTHENDTPRCAICEQPILPHDRCVALEGGQFRHLVCRTPEATPRPRLRRQSERLAHVSFPKRKPR